MRHILIFSGVEEVKVKVINEKCEKSAADDKTLPKSAYLVTYVKEEKITYDIVMADSRVEIFDHYWDTYKEGLQSISWTKGNVCLLYTSPSPRDGLLSRMPSSA